MNVAAGDGPAGFGARSRRRDMRGVVLLIALVARVAGVGVRVAGHGPTPIELMGMDAAHYYHLLWTRKMYVRACAY
jgi:hypothetical protein